MNNVDTSEIINLVVDLKYKKRDSRSFRYLLDRAVRKIHDHEIFPITPAVKEVLRDYGIPHGEFMSKNEKQKFNKILKKKGFEDSIMIEHMFSVKKIVDGLMEMELSDFIYDAAKQVEDYLTDKTDCVMKLTEFEREMHG